MEAVYWFEIHLKNVGRGNLSVLLHVGGCVSRVIVDRQVLRPERILKRAGYMLKPTLFLSFYLVLRFAGVGDWA